MYPYIYIFGAELPTYFICGAVGFIVTFFLIRRLLLDRLLFTEYMKVFLLSFIGLGIGARIFGIISRLLYCYQVSGTIDILEAVKSSGIVFLGGLLGYIIALWIICKAESKNFRQASNIVAIGIPLFHAFGRIGCFLSGCCYGIKSDSFISIPYRLDFGEEYIKRIPVQLMEAVFEFSLFTLIINIYNHKLQKGTPDEFSYLWLYLVTYCLWRFIIEFFRGDDVRFVAGGVSFSQIVLICIMIFLFYIYERNDLIWERL